MPSSRVPGAAAADRHRGVVCDNPQGVAFGVYERALATQPAGWGRSTSIT
jgi:hypothetical protein